MNSVCFSLEKGETLAVVGESGAGKSSLSLGIMRILPDNANVSSGAILFEGQDCMKLPADVFRKQVRWKEISMVFQGAMDSLHPVKRIEEQIAEALATGPRKSEKQIHYRVNELLFLVRLPEQIGRRYPHELSGGMKQRVMIAMALACDPKIVILDEPTSALDVIIQAQIMNLLKVLKKKLNLASIFITHDLALASDLADKIAVMYAGEIVELGTAEQILLEPKHPYTVKLLASIPRIGSCHKPAYIPGAPPRMITIPEGCLFKPRCPSAQDMCDTHPEIREHDNKRLLRCWENI